MSLARNLAWPMAAAKPELLLLLLSWLAVDDISMPRLQNKAMAQLPGQVHGEPKRVGRCATLCRSALARAAMACRLAAAGKRCVGLVVV